MDILYQLQGVEFEWGETKATSNLYKHGILFEAAAEVFFDPFYLVGDASVDDDEWRDYIIGYTFSQRLLLVVYTQRGERNRIISARPATWAERKQYEET